MKRFTFFISILFASFTALAQDYPYISPELVNDEYSGIDTMYLSKSVYVAERSKLRIGTGTMIDGDFQHIQIAVNPVGTNRNDYAVNALSRQYSGKQFKVLRVERRGNRRTGYVHYAVIRVAGIQYEVDIMNALATREVIVPGYDVPEREAVSVADELMKFAELKESGIITEDEFEAQKAKLLNK